MAEKSNKIFHNLRFFFRNGLSRIIPAWFAVFLLFFLVIAHYLLWVYKSSPLPGLGSLAQYFYPVQNYLRVSLAGVSEHQLLVSEFFSHHYPHGVSLIAGFCTFFGLAELVLSEPYFLNFVVILPFLLGVCCFRDSRKNYFLIGVCLCFFPVTQICIKQFSLHGINLAYAFLGFLFLRSYLALKKGRNRWFLWLAFILSFAFAAVAKHLGLAILLNLFLAYISWLVLGGRRDRWVFVAFLLIFLLIIPFYDWAYQLEYLRESVGHNPDMSYIAFILSMCGFFFLVPGLAFLLRPFSRCRRLPKIFRYGFTLCFISPVLLALLSHRLFWPAHLPIFFIGYTLIILLILCFELSSLRGFVYLFILINGVHLAVLFGSGAAYTSYTLLCSVLLMAAQTISETPQRCFYFIFAIAVVLMANFFPGIYFLDKWFGSDGRCVYTQLFHSPHHNPLGWQNYGYGDLKKQLIVQWSEACFKEKPLFLVENFGPYTSAQFVFFRNVLYPFPEINLLEAGGLYKKMYSEYQLKGEDVFVDLFKNMDIPLILYTGYSGRSGRSGRSEHSGQSGRSEHSGQSGQSGRLVPEERDTPPLGLEKLINAKDFSIDNVNDDAFVFAFNQALIDWAERMGILSEHYSCLDLPIENPFVRSCVDKRLLGTGEGRDFGNELLMQIIERDRLSRAGGQGNL